MPKIPECRITFRLDFAVCRPACFFGYFDPQSFAQWNWATDMIDNSLKADFIACLNEWRKKTNINIIKYNKGSSENNNERAMHDFTVVNIILHVILVQ